MIIVAGSRPILQRLRDRRKPRCVLGKAGRVDETFRQQDLCPLGRSVIIVVS